MSGTIARTLVSVAGALSLASGLAVAQAPASSTPAPVARPTVLPQRETLGRFMRPVTVDLKDTRLEDVMRFIGEVTQADIEVMWVDDRNTTGLDKDAQVNVKVTGATVLDLLEKVLEKASGDSAGATGSTWQLSETGTMQIGPRDRLNKFKRVELYPINDLLLEIRNYDNAPEFDLQNVLQNTGQGGGGGGQSPFRDQQQQRTPGKTADDKAKDLMTLLTTLVEPEQWADNGGDGGSMHFFQNTLIVNAPDYMHRAINGYPYWPSSSTRVAQGPGGRRYVTLGVDTAFSTLTGMGQVPVTAVVGGRLISSDPTRRGPGGMAVPADKPGDKAAKPADKAKSPDQAPEKKPEKAPADPK